MELFAGSPRRPRPEITAIPLIVLATFSIRAKSLAIGVGGDEFSLMVMADVIRQGGLPYADFWDVRPPLAYLWGLPSTTVEDTVAAVKTLRLFVLLVHGIAAWLFFCLFRRQLGSLAAAMGTVALLVSANMEELHHVAVPNHFVMAMSLGAFASVVEGIRRNLRTMYLTSAVLAGLLPWMMVHAALAAMAIALLAVLGTWATRRRWALSWLAVAALPTIAVVGVYALRGPFDTFARTVFLAPLDFVTERFARETSFFPDPDTGVSLAMLIYAGLIVAGVALLPLMVRRAAAASPLRLSPWLVLPSILPAILMGYVKGGAPEYWVDAAPAAALLVAAAARGVFTMRAWTAFDRFRFMRPPVLRGCIAMYLGFALILLTASGKEKPDPPLPTAYCEAAAWWMERLEPGRTVLDTSALCSYWVLESNAPLHPPFTFVDNWFRQLDTRWIGEALAGDGSETMAADRLATAVGPTSTAGIILADGRLYDEIRERQWRAQFFREWRLVWFRSIDGYDAKDRFSMLALFVRRDAFPDAGLQWP